MARVRITIECDYWCEYSGGLHDMKEVEDATRHRLEKDDPDEEWIIHEISAKFIHDLTKR